MIDKNGEWHIEVDNVEVILEKERFAISTEIEDDNKIWVVENGMGKGFVHCLQEFGRNFRLAAIGYEGE